MSDPLASSPPEATAPAADADDADDAEERPASLIDDGAPPAPKAAAEEPPVSQPPIDVSLDEPAEPPSTPAAPPATRDSSASTPNVQSTISLGGDPLVESVMKAASVTELVEALEGVASWEFVSAPRGPRAAAAAPRAPRAPHHTPPPLPAPPPELTPAPFAARGHGDGRDAR